MSHDTEELPNLPMPRREGCPFDPPPSYADLRSSGLARARNTDGMPVWVVTDFECYKAVNANPGVFSSETHRAGYPGINSAISVFAKGFMSKADPPRHNRLRRSVSGEFSKRRMERLTGHIESIVDDLLDAMEAAGPPADFVADFALKLPNLVIQEMLGVPMEDRLRLHDIISKFLETGPDRGEPEAALGGYVSNLVAVKKVQPGDDVISRLLQDSSPERLDDDEIVSISSELIIGGFETTAQAICFGFLLLSQHPSQFDELRAKPELAPQAVEEILRFAGVTQIGRRRTAVARAELGESVVEAGDAVIAYENAANRDPAAFDAPDLFDIHRSGRQHVAFGYGPHTCIGAPLARIEMQVAFRKLLQRLPEIRLAVPVEQLDFNQNSVVYSVATCPVVW